MNPFSCIINLFEHEPDIIDINKDCSSMEEREERHNRLIQAVDIFLKEIELKVENIDFNKDKHQIKLLLQKFEDFDMELVLIHRSNESLKDYFENDKVLITKRTSSNLCLMYKKGRETYLFSLQFKNIISKKKLKLMNLIII
jgi:hypothetical protein